MKQIIILRIRQFLFAAASLCLSGWTIADTYTYDSLNRLTAVVYSNGGGQTYSYDAAGNMLSVVSVAPMVTLALVAVQSRKMHGSTNTFDLAIDTSQPFSGLVTVEPRTIGSGHTIVFQFDGPVSAPGAVSVTPVGTATASYLGTEVLVTLTSVPDNQRVTITLANVNGSVNPVPVSMGFLVGDVNNSRSVSSSDISSVKARSGQPTTTLNFRFDLNATGSINAADISAAKARSNLVLP